MEGKELERVYVLQSAVCSRNGNYSRKVREKTLLQLERTVEQEPQDQKKKKKESHQANPQHCNSM